MHETSVLIINQGLAEPGTVANVAFVVGLTAGRLLPPHTFGGDVADADGRLHRHLTRLPHFVRRAGESKLRALHAAFSAMPEVVVVDYSDDARTSEYEKYAAALATRRTEAVVYRALHVFGPSHLLLPLTKNLSRL
jgi:hypothetical protein